LKRIACQLAAVALMSTMLAAGTVCIAPAAASHPARAGCHQESSPHPPQPAKYLCCMSGYRPALLASFSLPRPALQAVAAVVAPGFVAVGDIELSSPNIVPASPPGVLALRI
jgi:hypothetical protein